MCFIHVHLHRTRSRGRLLQRSRYLLQDIGQSADQCQSSLVQTRRSSSPVWHDLANNWICKKMNKTMGRSSLTVRLHHLPEIYIASEKRRVWDGSLAGLCCQFQRACIRFQSGLNALSFELKHPERRGGWLLCPAV